MPRVSIIMPVYNGIRFIEESIRSILNQTYTDWEFIIINEFGSNDGSKEYIEYYSSVDPRIRLIQNNEKLGLAASLNEGLKAAKGEYVARVDVDDPSYPERFEKQVEYLDNHPDVTLCGCIQRSITPTSQYIQQVSTDVETLRASMIFGCEISHCSVMFRKQYFESQHLFYDPNTLAEDYDLWSKVMFKTKLTNLNEVLVDHRWGVENISIQKGEALQRESREISSRILREFQINIENEGINPLLLSGWNSKPIEYASCNPSDFLKQGLKLLTLLRRQNKLLHKIDEKAMDSVIWRRWNWMCDICEIEYDKTITEYPDEHSYVNDPMVSVILPVYNSAKYLRCAIDSIIKQTYHNWEILLINDYGSDDGSQEICLFYSMFDSRIHLLQSQTRLGLGESLNKGFREAAGKYLARLDADDTAHPVRLERQVNLMESRPEIGICGSYQHHFGTDCDWIHQPATDPEQCKANLLFWCDLCHSTLMLRKKIVHKFNLYFNSEYMAEDFELWSRAVRVTQITNIPEVLGEYRWGENNITLSKIEELRKESGKIVASSLRENLHIEIPEEKIFLLAGWGNLYQDQKDISIRQNYLDSLKEILINIYTANKRFHFYDEISLLTILRTKWEWAFNNESWHILKPAYSLEQVFGEKGKLPFRNKVQKLKKEFPGTQSSIKHCAKEILKPFFRPIHWRFDSRIWKAESSLHNHINNMTWDRAQYVVRRTDARIWKAEKRILQLEASVAELNFKSNYVPRYPGEKVRIAFIFQVASFWPSADRFYRSCLNDERFEIKVICYDEDFDSTIKTDTAREFLDKNHIDYVGYEEFDLSEFSPHVVVLQTPYDTNRRVKYTSTWLKSQGYRVVYIPYGIEIAATQHAQDAHFNMDVVKNCWRLYTLSEIMRKDYLKYCTNSSAVRAVGLPKFDSLYSPDDYPLNPIIYRKAQGRSIVLWKVHFPKVIKENGKNILVTPHISEYIKFAQKISDYQNLFFIFMPHPRFKEFNQDHKIQQELAKLMELLKKKENVYIDDEDDYRNSLMHSDCIIVDRSAVMVEAAATGVPILYMYNADFDEPLTDAIVPLIESYYHGTTCDDIERFLHMFLSGHDPLKSIRKRRFEQCIPFFDGKCGDRIKEDIISSIPVENNITLEYVVSYISKLEKKVDYLSNELTCRLNSDINAAKEDTNHVQNV